MSAHTRKTMLPSLSACILLVSLMFSALIQADSNTFLLRAPSSDMDERYHYELDVIRLALSKTEAEYGAFDVDYGPAMNNLRAVDYVRNNRLPNFFAYKSFDAREDPSNILHIPFPMHLGVVGYRVCVSSPNTLARLSGTDTLSDLQAFTFALGRGWGDVDILRHNQLTVIESPNYRSLFTRTVAGRIDLFCRGIHEFHNEMERFGENIPLSLEPDLLLYYPFPRFLYTHPSNHKNAERILIGLKRAYEDGSLRAIWEAYFRKGITAAQVHRRTLIPLENPQLEGANTDYQQYLLQPSDLGAGGPLGKE